VLVVDPEGSHWVRFVVTWVPASPEKPHGLVPRHSDYDSLEVTG
jgi:hypothetical protein